MSSLKDFQIHTVNYVYNQLYVLNKNRILVADEVGLGKTFVAKGVIDKRLNDFRRNKKIFRVLYICSNQNIARQNLSKLNVTQNKDAELKISRLSLLALKSSKKTTTGFLELMPISPNTSLKIKQGGWAKERAILYNLLMENTFFKKNKSRLKTILLNRVNKNTFKSYLKNECSKNKLDKATIFEFNKKLNDGENIEGSLFKKLQLEINNRHTENTVLIGNLRELLACVCLKVLKPDLIILDEFQRFKELLQDEHTTDIARILFSENSVKILMLSATPYKMFTIQSEEEEGVNHYNEFLEVLKFLMQETFSIFEKKWKIYSDGLINLKDQNNTELKQAKIEVENILRTVMCRTERIQVSDDHNAMICKREILLQPDRNDFNNFKIVDTIAKFFISNGRHVIRPIEFCKSVPYPLSFMDNYIIKKEIELEQKKQPWSEKFIKIFEESKNGWLNRNAIQKYKQIVYPNARFKKLLEMNVEKGFNLLFIPPSLAYYPLQGFFAPFNKHKGFSKTMVFSDLLMTPKAIAALASYEVERKTIGDEIEKVKDDEDNDSTKNKKRVYFIEDEKKRKPISRLIFKQKDGTPNSLNLFTLLYPSIYLTSLFSGKEQLVQQPLQSYDEVIIRIQKKIRKDLDTLNINYWTSKSGRVDENWYWILLMILDVTHFPELIKNMFETTENKNYFINNTDKSPAKSHYYFAYELILFGYSRNQQSTYLQSLNLGKLPDLDEIANTLALLTLGSPSVCYYRSLKSLFPPKTNGQNTYLLYQAKNLTDKKYLPYLNTPEHLSVIEKLHTIYGQFWRAVALYHANGCFQAVCDEFLFLIFGQTEDDNWEKKVEKLCISARKRIHLHTASVAVDTFESFGHKKKRDRLRTHYAVGFYDVNENEIEIDRKQAVQDTFNSPFRPFILATTSIGQEGLDFHYYCRNLMHWNLPSNPVDLEQREGRINRYMNHAVRLSIAEKYKSFIDKNNLKPLWEELFEIADKYERINGKCELVPYWHIENAPYKIERQLLFYPFSKEASRINNLLKTLSIYRIALGQPRQEELIEYLLKGADDKFVKEIQTQLLINLSPITYVS